MAFLKKHAHIATHTLTLRSSSIVTVKLGYTRMDAYETTVLNPSQSNIWAKINGHGIELGVPFQIDLRNRRSTHGTLLGLLIRKFD